MHHRDFPLVDAVMDSRGCAFQLLLSPCQPGLVSNGKSHLGHRSFRRGAQSSREYNLRVVWRGSQRVNLKCMCVLYVCMCVLYVCMYVLYNLCDCLMWWNWGWRWDNKAIPFLKFKVTNIFRLCNQTLFAIPLLSQIQFKVELNF